MWGIIYWFSLFALFLWLDHPARNFIAIIIFTFGLKYLLQRKICKYFFVCILASLFHASCIAMIPFYFFTQKLDSKKYKLALLLILAVYLWSSLLRDFIDTIVQVPIFLRLSSYTFDDYQGQMSIIKFIIIKGILILAVFNIDSLRKKYKYADFILVLSIIYAFLFSIANLNNILFRLQFYFAIPFVILISFLSSNAVSKRIRLSIRTFVIIFSFAYLLNLISRDYRYVPYSNYAYYMFNGLPYDYRDSYNLENSPFK